MDDEDFESLEAEMKRRGLNMSQPDSGGGGNVEIQPDSGGGDDADFDALEAEMKRRGLNTEEQKQFFAGENKDIDLSAGYGLSAENYNPEEDQGGSIWARAVVGSAQDPSDKVARGESIYGKGNFRPHQSEPENYEFNEEGKWKTFNPRGLDIGDLGGASREIISAFGGFLPALVGGATTGPGGIAAGAAASAATSQAYDQLMANAARIYGGAHGNPIAPSQSVGDAAKEFGTETATGMVGGALLHGLGRGLSKLFNPVDQNITQAYERMNAAFPGSDYQMHTAASVIPNKAVALAQNSVGSSIGGSGRISESLEKELMQNQRALNDISGKFSKSSADTVEDLGRHVYNAGAHGRKAASDAYDAAMKATGEETWGSVSPAQLNHVGTYITKKYGDLSPDIMAAEENGLYKQIQPYIEAATKGELTYNDLKHLAQTLREQIGAINIQTTSGMSQNTIRGLHSAVLKDLEESVPDFARDAWKTARRAYGKKMAASRILEKDLGTGAKVEGAEPDYYKIGQNALTPRKMNSYSRVMDEFYTDNDANLVRGGLIKNMGRGLGKLGDHNIARPNDILKYISKTPGKEGVSEQAQQRLFRGEMDDLRTILEGQQNAGKMYNFSNTENQATTRKQIENSMGYLGKIGQGVVGGAAATSAGLASAIPGLIATFSIPWLGARMLTNMDKLARPQSKWSAALLKQLSAPTGAALGDQVGQSISKKRYNHRDIAKRNASKRTQ